MSPQNTPAQSYRLELELRIDQKVVATVQVEDMDLIDVRTELWWIAFANQGRLDADRLNFAYAIEPIFHANARTSSTGACDGFVLTCIGADGGRHEVRCTVHALKRVAERKAQELLDNKIFTADTSYVYSLVARPELVRATSLRSAEDKKVSVSRLRATPLTWDVVPHAALLESAEQVGMGPGDRADVFFTRSAFEHAERVARRGAALPGSIETGGVLVGPLCQCPDTGRAFRVVTDVLEAGEAEGTTASLTFTAGVWQKLENVVRAMQGVEATRTHRILGQVHGHNHLPAGGPPCDLCDKVEVCTRSSAYLSDADERWCRAVFRAQPFQLSLIFGLNARGENVHAFYTQRNGRLLPHGFHLIPEYDSSKVLTRS